MFKSVITFVCLILIGISQLQAQQADLSQVTQQFAPSVPTNSPTDSGRKNTVTVPRRAGLKFATVTALSSATAKTGDQVPLRLVQPLVINNQTVLPAGTLVSATVTRVRRADKCRNGEVQWKLDRVAFPDSSTAKTKIWSSVPGPDLKVPARLFHESDGGDINLPSINEWWEIPLAAPVYAFAIVCLSPVLAIVAILLPFSLGNNCTVPGKEYELPAGSSVAVMITEAHHVSY